mmetsp:Transcript_28900/g.74257  ORF Transcript_28900/g.74257 Transcript_28900/m.74257 type:complete len:230 (-) Transcript_28900:1573-2262(-)
MHGHPALLAAQTGALLGQLRRLRKGAPLAPRRVQEGVRAAAEEGDGAPPEREARKGQRLRAKGDRNDPRQGGQGRQQGHGQLRWRRRRGGRCRPARSPRPDQGAQHVHHVPGRWRDPHADPRGRQRQLQVPEGQATLRGRRLRHQHGLAHRPRRCQRYRQVHPPQAHAPRPRANARRGAPVAYVPHRRLLAALLRPAGGGYEAGQGREADAGVVPAAQVPRAQLPDRAQ